ncbi:unnamed protein product [Didymodactylos carnosus]|uniref:NAD(P)(+)--arginine ADP-ribosyltransferase n=1 Tax=Didymodactylos carnosus TaxID=1234261 RepID=A0A813YZ29_9BILA|nr:unnamed protein product [Didymodactylos carnosus]CAF0890811.1 unnamed protein product [Didymodactylos carnosus]CAF3538870.1 unnamed protein product [Didymodactylos carnosus]CAF3675161.1 unnamed protein product [Didymodactylos carnosus]
MLAPISGYDKKPLMSLEETVKPLLNILPELTLYIWVAMENSKHGLDGLISDESAAIHLYTMEWSGQKNSLYYLLNCALREIARQRLIPWSGYLKLLLTALFKLPPVEATVWRGVRADLSQEYVEGSFRTWWALSSCTNRIKVLESPSYIGNVGVRTLFSINCQNGKSIRTHSYFKKEDKILLMPGTCFEVVTEMNLAEGLHIIHLQEKEPPVQLLTSPFALATNVSQNSSTLADADDIATPEKNILGNLSTRAEVSFTPEIISTEVIREDAPIIQSVEEPINTPPFVGYSTKELSLVNTSFGSSDAKNTEPKFLPRISLSPKFQLALLCTGDNCQLADELKSIFRNSFVTLSNVDICGKYIALMNAFQLVFIVS